jgi:hypothetical protein
MWPFENLSLETASTLSNIASSVFLFSLLIGLISTIAVMRLANVKEHHWEIASRKAHERIKELDNEIADANERSKALEVEAIQARAAIATSDERAARANERAAEAVKQAMEAEASLIKFRKPRHEFLTPEAVSLITEKLKSFPGTRFDIGHTKVDREQWDFLWRLEPAIRAAGWIHLDWVGGFVFKKNDWPGNHFYGEMGVIDVSIEVRPAFKEKLMPAAEALAAVLNEIGIRAYTGDDNNSSATDDAIHLIVGPKR